MQRLRAWFLVPAAAACFWAAGGENRALLASRAEHHLDATATLDNASPLLVFTTVVAGGFRGLVVDLLWLRASELQDQGKFFELVQLSDWITKFDPHSSQTWGFHAWNIAYNVSMMFPDAEERWRWVRNGIALLRDRGLRYSSQDARLYFELGWLFQHKLGTPVDPAHLYYKLRWAGEMSRVVGGAEPDYDAISRDSLRAEVMRRDYRLIPEIMREVRLRYGPLDWRAPETHAIYWAYRGRQYAEGRELLMCDRMIYQSLAAACFRGRIDETAASREDMFTPNLDLLPYTVRAYKQAMKDHPIDSVRESYLTFLRHVAGLLETQGQTEDAAWARSLLEESP